MLRVQALSKGLTPHPWLHLDGWRSLSTSLPRSSPPFRILLLGSDLFSCATLDALNDCPSGKPRSLSSTQADLTKARAELVKSIDVLTPARARSGRGLKLGPDCEQGVKGLEPHLKSGSHAAALHLRAKSLGLRSCSQLPHTGFVGWSVLSVPTSTYLSI